MSVYHSAKSGDTIGIFFRISNLNKKVCCVFSLESLNRGDSSHASMLVVDLQICNSTSPTIRDHGMGCVPHLFQM